MSRAVLAGFLFCAPVLAQVPIGGEFQVNTYTTGFQWSPSVSLGPAGEFVVVWQSPGSSGNDASDASVQGQRFSWNGMPLGGEFQVNTYTTGDQRYPSVSVGPTGEFVVVWQSLGSSGTDTSGASVQGQLFASDGTALGSEFQVNAYTTFGQGQPSVSVGAVGEFVVVWTSARSDGTDASSWSVQAQRFALDGTRLGGQFQVNTYTTDYQDYASVSVGPVGEFVVVWESFLWSGPDPPSRSVQGQRFASNGTPLGGEFQINTYTTDYQRFPSVSVGPVGEFVVVWQSLGSSGSDTSDASVQGQRFALNGTPLGGEFQVNTYTTGDQDHASVSVGPAGEFVVAWQNSGFVAGGGQVFASDGTPLGDEFQISGFGQSYPSVSVGPAGKFVVVWVGSSSGNDTSGTSIQGQRFFTGIFTDGFESGDLSAWSSSMP